MTRADRILAYVRSEAAAGRSVTVRDIQKTLTISSPSVVSYWLSKLRDQGRVTWEPGKSRTLRALGGEPELVLILEAGDDQYPASTRIGQHIKSIVSNRSGRLVFIPDESETDEWKRL
jgi:SOS-response transcriptional repressor LexA